jgi:hypothetical protein
VGAIFSIARAYNWGGKAAGLMKKKKASQSENIDFWKQDVTTVVSVMRLFGMAGY